MADDLKSVFVSYRRNVSSWFAQLVFRDLRAHDYDVFMDVESIDGGTFPDVIPHQIEARSHFVLLLEPGAFERVAVSGDWLRREIEHALDTGRNIVPLLGRRFEFSDNEYQSTVRKLPEKFARLSQFQSVTVHEDYVDAALTKLRARSLSVRPTGRIKPVPADERPAVQRMIRAAASVTPDDMGTGWSLSNRPTLVLEEDGEVLSWSAEGLILQPAYELERSERGEFRARMVYDGPERRFTVDSSQRGAWFRVRRKKGGLLLIAGDWSNLVYVPGPADTLLARIQAPAAPDAPEAPYLSIRPAPFTIGRKRSLAAPGVTLDWVFGSRSTNLLDTAIRPRTAPNAFATLATSPFETMCVLERAAITPALSWREIYSGCATTFRDTSAERGSSYRVKAIARDGRQSPWSNVVSDQGLLT